MANRNKEIEKLLDTEIDTPEKRIKETYEGVGTEQFTIEDYPYGEFKTISSEDELKQGTSYSPTMLDINELFEKGIVKRGDTIDLSELHDITTVQAASQEQLDMLTASSKEQITAIHLSNNTLIGWDDDYDYDNKYVMDRQLDLSGYKNVTEVETHAYLNSELEDIILPEKTTSLLCRHSRMENLSREGSLKNTDIELAQAEIAEEGNYGFYYEGDELVGIDISPTYELDRYVAWHPVLSTTKYVDKIFNQIKTKFRDDTIGREGYVAISKMLEKNFELVDKCLDATLVGIQSGGDNGVNNSYMLDKAQETISAILKVKPELADKCLDAILVSLQSGVDNGVSYSDTYGLDSAYKNISTILEVKPELADKCLDATLIGLQSVVNSGSDRMIHKVYENISAILEVKPELADKCLDATSVVLQSGWAYASIIACKNISTIVKAKPELADKCLDVVLDGLQSGVNDIYVLRTLPNIVKAKPELAGDVLSICKESIKSKNKYQIGYATDCIRTIANNNPDAIRDYLGVTDKDVQSVDVAELIAKTKDKLHKKDVKTEEASQQPETSNTSNVVLPNKGKKGYGD